MQMVREALNEGYCDISGRSGTLTLLGQWSSFRNFNHADEA